MQAYFGGRAEARIRHTAVPVVHTDIMSEYPTVNTLLGLWSPLTAETLRIEEATASVRSLLMSVTPEAAFDRDFWKNLSFYALVLPAGDVLPVRANYTKGVTNIAVNPLTSEKPIWYAGPDLVAATLLTRRPPTIIRAFRLVPEGQRRDLRSISLRGMVEINPRTHSQPKAEREALGYFLKILANAGSYGLFVEVNPERVGTDKKTGKPARARLRVFSGETVFEQTSPVIEKPGPWYCPFFAALITAGGRLLLALLERVVVDAGGSYLLCDTDSMAIVASEKGGPVPCVGGPHNMPGGSDAIMALSWADVREIATQFGQLNPYDTKAVPESILKIEKVNFDSDGKQRELWGFAIAAKRYALFTKTSDGGISVKKASAHGLGFLYPPRPEFDSSAEAPVWVVAAWDWIIRKTLGLSCDIPSWFDLPAMMRFTVTTPEVLRVLQARQRSLPYRDRTKPFNFVLSPIIDRLTGGYPIGADPNRFTLVTPFTSDTSTWAEVPYVNVHDGKTYKLACFAKRMPYEAEAKSYGDVVSRYRFHPEAKSSAPGGNPCTSRTHGILQRTPVTADCFRYIGKETDTRWEQGEDFNMLDSKILEYRANETERLTTDVLLQRELRRVSIRALARAAGVSDKTVKAARKGNRLRKSTIGRLKAALDVLRRDLESSNSFRGRAQGGPTLDNSA